MVSILHILQMNLIQFLGDNTSMKNSILKIFLKPGQWTSSYLMASTISCDLSPIPNEAYWCSWKWECNSAPPAAAGERWHRRAWHCYADHAQLWLPFKMFDHGRVSKLPHPHVHSLPHKDHEVGSEFRWGRTMLAGRWNCSKEFSVQSSAVRGTYSLWQVEPVAKACSLISPCH